MIIAVAMQKGGSAKTTTAAAIWAAHPRSLAIDLDVQSNLTLFAGADDEDNTAHNVCEVLTGNCKAQEAIQELSTGDVICSSQELSLIGDIPPSKLREVLTPVKDQYKYVILDTPPALSLITLNALVAADMLVIPMKAEPGHIQGLIQLSATIDAARDENPNLKVAGILLTQFNERTILRRQMRDQINEIAQSMNTRVFESTIRDAVAIPESQALMTDIYSYAPKAKVTQDYRAFVAELDKVIKHG